MAFIDIITLLGLLDKFISYYHFYEIILRYYENVIILMKGRVFINRKTFILV